MRNVLYVAALTFPGAVVGVAAALTIVHLIFGRVVIPMAAALNALAVSV